MGVLHLCSVGISVWFRGLRDGRSRRKGSCPVLGCRRRSPEAPTSGLPIVAFCLGLAWKHPGVRGGASSPQGVQHPQGPGTDWALCLLSGEVASFREEGGSVEMEMRGQLPPGTAGRSLGGWQWGVRQANGGWGWERGLLLHLLTTFLTDMCQDLELNFLPSQTLAEAPCLTLGSAVPPKSPEKRGAPPFWGGSWSISK